jgi:iron complex outermembrane receptor protein
MKKKREILFPLGDEMRLRIRKMKLTILMTFLVLASFGNSFSQVTLSLNFNKVNILEVLSTIEKKTDYIFMYKDDVLQGSKEISLDFQDAKFDEVLKSICAQSNIDYEVRDRQIILKEKVILPTQLDQSQPQKKEISGTVKDSKGGPIPGATVMVKGTTTGITTDMDGKFQLSVPFDAKTLVISFIGMKAQELVLSGKTSFVVALEDEAFALEEVVAVGYGTQRKIDQTGATDRLTSEKMNKSIATSPAEMMQGRISGVNITQNNGEPGAGMSVRIRGSNSIRSGQEPLYVIDGIPLDNADITPNGGTAAGINESSKKNPISFLNPEDIESMDVLKDASSTAIYGARGANGVVLITTKKGKKGVGTISYDGYTGISQIRKKMDILSAAEFRSYRKADGSALLDEGASVDWQDEIFRTAVTQSHNLSFGGGTENFTYQSSLGYLDQEGIVKRTGVEKLNGKLKITQSSFNNRLNIVASIIASHVEDFRVPISETGGFEGDVILTALKSNPTYPIRNADGSYYQYSKDQRNPIAMINLVDDITKTDRVLANFSAEFEIIKNLKYKVNIGFDRTNAERRVNQDQALSYMVNKGEANINKITANNKLVENYFTYLTKIGEKHNFNFLLGHAYQDIRLWTNDLRVYGFEVKDIKYTNNLQYGKFSEAVVSSSASERELQSFFGRANYGFVDKYLFTVTGRYDGSSKFGANKKYGFFPSAAFAWRSSEEQFIKDLNIFSNLKMRLGYGVTGNQEIPDKISLLAVGTTPSANGYFNGVLTPGITFLRTPNPDLQWETTYQANLGLDFGFWKNRLTGTIDIFNKQTKDVLLEIPAKAPAATQTQWQNVPGLEIINNGIELGLNTQLIRKNDLTWDLGVNFATIKNEVKNLPVKLIETGNASGQGLSGTRVQIITNGQPIGTFYGLVYQGLDASGMSIYKKDASGAQVKEYLGSALPKFTYSFNTRVDFKKLDFSMFWYGTQGNKVYNNAANALFVKGPLDNGSNVTQAVFNSKESPANANAFSSRFVEDASYLRLSNVTIGYTIRSKEIKWLSSARVYATGNNLLVITKYTGFDPEVSINASQNGVPSLGMDYTAYPKARTFTLGINLQF